ncbi:lysine-2,3-aminomutase-like protein [Frigidibacter sp. RF13]|uniref:lysine-2,3-aminomutase-like protein n=1 Tax=Frigidibacter sp. RF13 TaxID=2997340 RepID=UPI002270FF71|nr:lysine-2,3-aminomutase-like protein [Frigidibacter sp. RF13]MCY1126007.1 lysine-2,3-aminomutase-like protein [Frigidibacter sp. RF13]
MPRAKLRALTTVDQLVAEEWIAGGSVVDIRDVVTNFSLRISAEMRQAIGSGDHGLLRQFVPSAAELRVGPEELSDPIGDRAHMPVDGLTHRYPDRVILAVTQACDVYCRFCFRREVVGQGGLLGEAALAAALDYIRATPAINEVILTGGDPMTLAPRRLRGILEALAEMDHVALVRLHSRVPVVAPERIDSALIAALGAHPAVWIVLHSNHAAELTENARAALGRLSAAGIPLLSQTVLLRGVNDDAEVLAQLFRSFLRLKVKPYYLHHCDLARGTSHFRTTIAGGQALMAALRGRVSGTALPTYVIDIPGGFGKVPVADPWVRAGSDPGAYLLTDWRGGEHLYRDPERAI